MAYNAKTETFIEIAKVSTAAMIGIAGLGLTGNVVGGLFGVIAGQVCCNKATDAIRVQWRKHQHRQNQHRL